MANAATDYLELEWMKYAFTATAMGTRPTAWYLALHTADPTEPGNVGECSYSGYARQSITFSQAANVCTSTNSQAFPAIAGSSQTITHFSIWDAASSGNCLFKGALDLGKTFAVSDVPNFATGEVIISVD